MRILLIILILTRVTVASTCKVENIVQHCENVKVVHLRGEPIERASQLGLLLKQGGISREVLDYFSFKVEEVAKLKGSRHLGVIKKIYFWWSKFLLRNIPESWRDELIALGKSSGLGSEYFFKAIVLPDTGVAIHAFFSQEALKHIPTFGCTSTGKKGDNDSFYLGRNLDFSGAGVWDKFPSLVVHIPPPGSKELKHVSIGADGAYWAGVTGINEAGITFAAHQNYSSYMNFSGVPLLFIGENLLRNVRTLDEAKSYLLNHPRSFSLWTFVISDLKTGQVMAVESANDQIHFREAADGIFAQANNLNDPTAQKKQSISLGVLENSLLRSDIAKSILKEQKVSPQVIAKILSYHSNPQGELSIHKDILKPHTIQTVIFAKEKEEIYFYLANQLAPTSSGTYLKFKLKDFWETKPITYSVEDLANTPTTKRNAQVLMSRAYQAYVDKGELVNSFELLKDWQSLPSKLFLSINLYEQGKFKESVAMVDSGLSAPTAQAETPYLVQSLQWTKILALLGQGALANALAEAKRLKESDVKNPAIETLLDKLLKKQRLSKKELKIHFDFFGGDISKIAQ